MHQSIRRVLLLSLMYACSAIAAEHYTITDLGTMGFDGAHATGINSAGTVVGFAETFRLLGRREVRPFIYSRGAMKDLREAVVLAMPKHCALENDVDPVITDANDVLGRLSCGHRKVSTFLYRDGAVTIVPGHVKVASTAGVLLVTDTDARIRRIKVEVDGSLRDLGALDGVKGNATGINSAGEVVGWWPEIFGSKDMANRAWLWSDGRRRDLSFLPYIDDIAINAQGEVIGDAGTYGSEHAFLYSDGTMRDLGTLGGRWSRARAINKSGQIVGLSDTGKHGHAFLWENGAMKDLNDLVVDAVAQFVTLVTADGINDAGVIIANGGDSRLSTGPRAYMLTPLAANP
jgi:probable HAF family extracellular repeat protein